MEDVKALLEKGEFTDCKLLPIGSNYTYLATITHGPYEAKAVYKPQSGEMPLWDYPSGTLYLREYASFLVSQAMGWCFVPTTIIREGPYGIGAVQLFIEAEHNQHYFTFKDQCRHDVQRIAVFDAITNNGDRKAGHCLKGADGRIWGIDHGLTFHYQHRLRTVIWDFQGQQIPDGIIKDLEEFRSALRSSNNPLVFELGKLLTRVEVEAFLKRLDTTISSRVFPTMDGGRRNTPWPPV